jgi:hypothetical protein
MVGLSNVDDTSDANKPISASVQTLDSKYALEFANTQGLAFSSNTKP